MKKLLLVATLSTALTGCVSIDTSAFDDAINGLMGVEMMTTDKFCDMKKADLAKTKKSYEGKVMLPTGQITVIQKQGSDNVVGLKTGNDVVYAKVKDLKGARKGDTVKIRGTISSANFKSATNCSYFLLDNATIQSRK